MRRLPPKVKPPSLSTHYRSTRHGAKLELVSVKRRAKVQTPHHQDPGASADFRKTREEGDLQWYSIEGVNNCAESRTETITFFDATYPYKRYQFSASVVQCTFLQLIAALFRTFCRSMDSHECAAPSQPFDLLMTEEGTNIPTLFCGIREQRVSIGEPSRSSDVEAPSSDFLCYGQTPFPPICILVLKPLSSWLQRALHTMGMEGGFDQCSGNPPPSLVLLFSKEGYIEDVGRNDARPSFPNGKHK
ncbi:hypothetical protein AZE42_00684 [Rhizopogon vesiculosus]|uniref:Uncharacterized protein n=1 Tax=Rhizopogon vesiculosus TaxID=180088 RepID=A0A1J8QBR9_9AGAM|nr:hypothetical protein AZE42_00684 [Rhizopogon vesiculosus]